MAMQTKITTWRHQTTSEHRIYLTHALIGDDQKVYLTQCHPTASSSNKPWQTHIEFYDSEGGSHLSSNSPSWEIWANTVVNFVLDELYLSHETDFETLWEIAITHNEVRLTG